MSMKSGWKGSEEDADDFITTVLVKCMELKLGWTAFIQTKHKPEWGIDLSSIY